MKLNITNENHKSLIFFLFSRGIIYPQTINYELGSYVHNSAGFKCNENII
jgi:hypothetical protein